MTNDFQSQIMGNKKTGLASFLTLLLAVTCLAILLNHRARSASRVQVGTPTATTFRPDQSTESEVAARYGTLPLSFELNQGQVDQQVKFLSHGPGYDLFLTDTGAVLTLTRLPARKDANAKTSLTDKEIGNETLPCSVLRLTIIGANPEAPAIAQDELPGKINYLIGNDPERWHTNVPTYARVRYQKIYPGVDLVYYGNQRQLEYDLEVAPGADLGAVKFRLKGTDRIRLDKGGDLLLTVSGGEVSLRKPLIYQLSADGERLEVSGGYVIRGNEVAFKVGKHDSTKPLVIDPVLSYSTYIGSNGGEIAYGIAVDSSDSAYITGSTNSFSFPTTPGAFQTTNNFGFSDAFVTKLNPTGSALVYSTYLGGSDQDNGYGIAVDKSGNAYITGNTTSTNFPSVNAIRGSYNFLKTVDSGGNWNGKNLGGAGGVYDLKVDPVTPSTIFVGADGGVFKSADGGNNWIAIDNGLTNLTVAALAIDPINPSTIYAGANTPSPVVYKSTDGGSSWNAANNGLSASGQIFALTIDPVSPSTLYLGSYEKLSKTINGGNSWSAVNNGFVTTFSVAIDPKTPSTIYAGTYGLFKSSNGGATWSNSGTGLPNTQVWSIAIDPSNSTTIYIGTSNGVFKSTNSGGNWSAVGAGIGNSIVRSMAVSPSNPMTVYAGAAGNIFRSLDGGNSWSPTYATLPRVIFNTLVVDPGAPSTVYSGTSINGGVSDSEAFVTKLNPSGSAPLYSTYLGGSGNETGYAIAVDSSGSAYVTGLTASADFLTKNAFQPALIGGIDAFVTRLDPSGSSLVYSTFLGGNGGETGYGIAVDPAGNAYVTGETTSTTFPLMNPFQATKGESFTTDAFVTKFNSAGTLAYSTYLGGNVADTGYAIAVDSSGNAYVTGQTGSSNFPLANPIQSTNDNYGSAFASKLNSVGNALVYSTYLGGSFTDTGRGIAVDNDGSAYVTGTTSSTNFPIVNSFKNKSGFFQSTDSGATWSNDTVTGLIDSNVNVLTFDPTTSLTLYAGIGSSVGGPGKGISKSTDGGRHWSVINTGVPIATAYAIVVDPKTTSNVYAGFDAGVFRSTNGGSSWTSTGLGLPAISLAADPVTPSTVYAGTFGFGIFKSTDDGSHWSAINVGLNGPYVAAIAIDPLTPSTIYAGTISPGGGIWKSTNSGGSWSSINTGLTSSEVQRLNIDPTTPAVIYAGTKSGIFKSTNGGNNWTLSLNQPFAYAIAVDPTTPGTVYAGIFNGGVFKTTDGGNNWGASNNGLFSNLVNAVAINPKFPATIYAGVSMSTANDDDAFLTKINAAGTAFIYSTYLGGSPTTANESANDAGYAVAVDSLNQVYVTGVTASKNFPVSADAYQPFNRGFNDAFVARLLMAFTISGKATDQNGAAIVGAKVTLGGPQLKTTLTGIDGFYSFTNLPAGNFFSVGITKPQYMFNPNILAFGALDSDQTANFTGTASNAPFFTISGRVKDGGAGVSGVNLTLSGSQFEVTTTDVGGFYSFTAPGGGSYSVTPSAIGFAFSPASLAFNNLSGNAAGDFDVIRQGFVVTNTNDHGPGTLRQAILDANASPGLDTIVFNIPGSGVRTINPLVALPDITDPVVIDGTTQPGFAGTPIIELSGSGPGSSGSGFRISAGSSTVRGFVINGFADSGIALFANGNNLIQGNYIGTDPMGTARHGNNINGIVISNSSNNLIGGTTPSARNVISGNSNDGVIASVNSSGNRVQGNFIGTDATGTTSLGNGQNGVEVSANNIIGGTALGAGNLISGNQRGIYATTPNNIIQGNLVGTDITGTKKVGNLFTGIESRGSNNLVGGTASGARNIISGNGTGVVITGSLSRLQGNFIGTDITGTVALGNTFNGVVAGDNAFIGGISSEARNVISGNGDPSAGYGNVTLGDNLAGSTVTVQGNYIGMDVTGNIALSNPRNGITIFDSNNVIGGLLPGSRNVISGNSVGIQIGSVNTTVTGNLVQGNYVGLNAAGNVPLPNKSDGISVNGSSNNTIGGAAKNAGNTIASNMGAGVFVSSGTGNAIRRNSIFNNGGLGIDLGSVTGVTANDVCDVDTGPNNLQNYPVLSSAVATSSSTTVQGTLNSTSNTKVAVEVFSNTACDASGNGEGQTFIGSTTVTTDVNCNAVFNVVLPFAVGGQFVTATATDPTGNTSEFSSCVQASGPPGPIVQFDSSNYSVNEGSTAATITVTRSGDASGAVTVDFATSDDTAHQSGDYSVASGTLTFAGGETSKTFAVLINKDAYVEGNEKINLALENPSGGATLGSGNSATLTIIDDPSVPSNIQPLDAADAFVSQHYHDFLSREPDPSGFGFWTGQITQCGNDQTCVRNKRIDVSNAFFYELEYQQTGSYVERLYRAAFGNNQPFPNPIPDPNHPGEEKKVVSYQAFVQDRARVVGGSSLAQSQLDLANAFVLRPDFLTKYPAGPDGPGFVDAVLATIKNDIGVDLTAQRTALINLFNSGGRGAVLYRLADDNTQTNPIDNRAFIDAEYNRAFVFTQYAGYLRRDADMAGFLFWLGQVSSAPLRDVPKQHAMVCSFITSAEYQLRFSSIVTHSNAECPR